MRELKLARNEGRFSLADFAADAVELIVAGSVKGRRLHGKDTLDFANCRNGDGLERAEGLTLPRLSDERGEIETEIGPHSLPQDCQRDFGVKRRPGDVLETRRQHDSFLDAAKVRYCELC